MLLCTQSRAGKGPKDLDGEKRLEFFALVISYGYVCFMPFSRGISFSGEKLEQELLNETSFGE